MLVDALAARWLVSSLHCHNCIVFIVLLSILAHNLPMRGAKVQPFFNFAKPFLKKSLYFSVFGIKASLFTP